MDSYVCLPHQGSENGSLFPEDGKGAAVGDLSSGVKPDPYSDPFPWPSSSQVLRRMSSFLEPCGPKPGLICFPARLCAPH